MPPRGAEQQGEEREESRRCRKEDPRDCNKIVHHPYDEGGGEEINRPQINADFLSAFICVHLRPINFFEFAVRRQMKYAGMPVRISPTLANDGPGFVTSMLPRNQTVIARNT